MKKLIVFISALFFLSESFGQCDVSQKLFSVSPSVISIGQTAQFKFTVMNEGTDPNCSYPVGAVAVVLSIPSSGYRFQSIVSPVAGSGDYFSWSYDAANLVVVGINHTPLPAGKGETDITIEVIGVSAKEAASDLNISVLDGSSNLSTENDPGSKILKVSSAPLPVRLVSFTGKSTPSGNELNWKTSAELNFSHYEIEKSVDSKVFKKIGIVNGSGNNKENLSYTFIDKNSLSGMVPGATTQQLPVENSYYRLKLVDFDGTHEYSKILFINNTIELAEVGNFYPNPTTDNVTFLDINAPISSEWYISSYDLSGRFIKGETRKLVSGTNILKFETESITGGLIIYRFENSEGVQYRKLNK